MLDRPAAAVRLAAVTAIGEVARRHGHLPHSGEATSDSTANAAIASPTEFVMPRTRRRFWPAVTAFLILPGTVAFLVPWLLRPRGEQPHVVGIPVLIAGIVLLLWCVRDFYVVGRGSLAPWAPPERLVVVGLYRVSRNPMYIAVLVILCGWAATFGSRTLWIYAGVIAVAFHLRVIFGEEPWLARTHGVEWATYRAHVPRWLGIVTQDRQRKTSESDG